MQFDELEKEMISDVECHFDVIFCFLNNRNYDFFKSIKRQFKLHNGN